MSFRRGKKLNQTPLLLEGSTFESVATEPFVGLSFRKENDPPAQVSVLTLVVNVSMRDSGKPTTEPIAIWKGDAEGVGGLQPLIGQMVQEAFARRDGQIEIKFDNRHTLSFEPAAEGEWRLQRLSDDKVVFSITWSDGRYIT